MRAASVVLCVGLLAVSFAFVACRDPAVGGPTPAARGGTCRPSSIPTGKACPERAVPPSNASSSSGCKSDADCKDGRQGRCVRFGVSLAPAERSNLLAGPPPPPPETICAYDECATDADCGAKSRLRRRLALRVRGGRLGQPVRPEHLPRGRRLRRRLSLHS